MPVLGMVIDLRKCVGCGTCAMACKLENNTRSREGSAGRPGQQTFNWADFFVENQGSFPHTKYSIKPTNCNHCAAPACVKACEEEAPPAVRGAMFKTDTGVVLVDYDRCDATLCGRRCQVRCPYSFEDATGKPLSVISYNFTAPHGEWNDTSRYMGAAAIANPAEAKAKSGGTARPYLNKYADVSEEGKKVATPVRRKDVVEKCTFCYQRIKGNPAGRPACVEACPPQARMFGDLTKDPLQGILGKGGAKALSPLKGRAEGAIWRVAPKVFYINNYSAR